MKAPRPVAATRQTWKCCTDSFEVAIWAPIGRPRGCPYGHLVPNRRPGAVGCPIGHLPAIRTRFRRIRLRGSPRTRYLDPPGYLRVSVPALLSNGPEEAFLMSSTILRRSTIDRALSTRSATAAPRCCSSRCRSAWRALQRWTTGVRERPVPSKRRPPALGCSSRVRSRKRSARSRPTSAKRWRWRWAPNVGGGRKSPQAVAVARWPIGSCVSPRVRARPHNQPASWPRGQVVGWAGVLLAAAGGFFLGGFRVGEGQLSGWPRRSVSARSAAAVTRRAGAERRTRGAG